MARVPSFQNKPRRFGEREYVFAIEWQNVQRGREEAKPGHGIARQQELFERLFFGGLQRRTGMLPPIFAQLREGFCENVAIPFSGPRQIDDLHPAAFKPGDVPGPGTNKHGICHTACFSQPVANEMPDLTKVWIIKAVSNEHGRLCDELVGEVGCDERILGQESIIIGLSDHETLRMTQVTMKF